ncbi:MAG: hypothetical protein Tsb0014_26800 [Pleurocapsa sp.]
MRNCVNPIKSKAGLSPGFADNETRAWLDIDSEGIARCSLYISLIYNHKSISALFDSNQNLILRIVQRDKMLERNTVN